MTLLLHFIGVILVCVSALDARRFRCDYKYFPEVNGWLKLHQIPANWQEARLRCQFEGAKLASPLNMNLHNAMKTLISQLVNKESCGGVFTGIHATFSRGDFYSIEGVPLNKIPHTWTTGEPNNYNDEESCIAIDGDGKFGDVSCVHTLPYICYRQSANNVINSCGTVDPDYYLDSRTGSCYKFHKVPRTWSRAYMACSGEGGYLAIINNEVEAQVVRELFAKNPGGSMVGNFWKDVAFVGFHDWAEHGEWLTIHGQTLREAGYDKFSGGEPNNATTGEYCGAVYRSALFDDLWCENKYAFICEKQPESLLCDGENDL